MLAIAEHASRIILTISKHEFMKHISQTHLYVFFVFPLVLLKELGTKTLAIDKISSCRQIHLRIGNFTIWCILITQRSDGRDESYCARIIAWNIPRLAHLRFLAGRNAAQASVLGLDLFAHLVITFFLMALMPRSPHFLTCSYLIAATVLRYI